MHTEKPFSIPEDPSDPDPVPLASEQSNTPTDPQPEETFLLESGREAISQQEALAAALGVTIVPFSDLPSRHEGLRRIPLSQRTFIQRIGPLAMQMYDLDIKQGLDIEELKLENLLNTSMSIDQIAQRLHLPTPKAAKDAQNRLHYRICQVLRRQNRGELIADLEAALAKEHEDKQPQPDIDPDHPGLVIDMLRFSLTQKGRHMELDDISARIIGKRAEANKRAVTLMSYKLRGFLLGHHYLIPARTAELLEAMDVNEERRGAFMQLYTEIYKRTRKDAHARSVVARRLGKVTAEEAPGSNEEEDAEDWSLLRETINHFSPFRQPLGEDGRKPYQKELREYIARIGPIALTHKVALSEHLTRREVKLCLMVRDGKKREEIKRGLNLATLSWVSQAIGHVADKIHFALPEDKRAEITANLRAEIAAEFVQLREPYPGHIGPRINAIRHMMIERGRGTPATLQGLAETLRCGRNEVLGFFEGRTYMRPERVKLILTEIGVPLVNHEHFMAQYQKNYEATNSERARRGHETRRKNKSEG